LAQPVWARAPDDVGQRTRRKQRPSSQQEGQTWLTRLEAVGRAHEGCPQPRLVSGGDRDAAVYDLRAAVRPAGVELVLRAAWDRAVSAPERYVWATVEAPPLGEHRREQVPRRGPHPGRDAPLALRLCPVPLRPPRHRQAEGLSAVVLGAVQVREVEAPDGVEPLEWRWWTTVAVPTVADAIERVEGSAWRWGLAGWPRLVTSGGRIEARQLATGARLPRGLTRSSVMAGRVFSAPMRARAVPEMPCRVLWALEAGQARYGAIHHWPTPPAPPPSLGQAVRWLAQLGGLRERRCGDQPGAETWWRGLQPLTDVTSMDRMRRVAPP
jgi:hypothetical protein